MNTLMGPVKQRASTDAAEPEREKGVERVTPGRAKSGSSLSTLERPAIVRGKVFLHCNRRKICLQVQEDLWIRLWEDEGILVS